MEAVAQTKIGLLSARLQDSSISAKELFIWRVGGSKAARWQRPYKDVTDTRDADESYRYPKRGEGREAA
jgi:hypothetical protein